MMEKILYCDTKTFDLLSNNSKICRSWKDICGIIHTHQLGIDRTNKQLNFDELDFYAPAFDYEITNDSLEMCLMKNTEYFNKMPGNKILMWSGGIDSTAMLVSFIKSGYIKDYKIAYTDTSIEEYPQFFEKHIKKLNCYKSDAKNFESFINKLIDGGKNNIIGGFGHSIPNYENCIKNNLYLNDSSSKVFNLLKYDESKDLLIYNFSKCPVEIETVDDAYWFIRLIYEFNKSKYKFGLITDKAEHYKNCHSYYSLSPYLSWEISNRNLITRKSFQDPWDKKHLKEFIFDFTKDEYYFNTKQQTNSVKLSFGTSVYKYKRNILFKKENIK